MSAQRTVAALAVSAGVSSVVGRLPSPRVPGWQRTNYRGHQVSLSGGFAAACGALAGALLSGPSRQSTVFALGSAMLAGGYDDLVAPRGESQRDKGLGGHLRALRTGRVSGGAVKVALIGTGSLLAAASLPTAGDGRRGLLTRVGTAALIAGTANLVNLFDLRPGRAAKVTLLACAAATMTGRPGPLVAAAAGATLAELPGDLTERTMLGDLGANTLGALVGVRLAGASRPVRIVALAIVGGLTVASERFSFTRIIAAVAPLRWFDELGRIGSTTAGVVSSAST